MGPVLEKKKQSIVPGNHREQCAFASRVTKHWPYQRDNNSTKYIHNLNEQQTNAEPTTPMLRWIRSQTVVMQLTTGVSITWLMYNPVQNIITQYKITDQILGKVCSHELWLWK